MGYRKFKNKEVSAAARSLVALFRELAPGMLAKKDRGRDADLVAAPAEYGATEIRDRIEVRSALRDAVSRQLTAGAQGLAACLNACPHPSKSR